MINYKIILTKTYFYDIMYLSRKLEYNKKGTPDFRMLGVAINMGSPNSLLS